MSSTNKTAELHLSQFIGTDIPSILTDYNGDMQKIDAGVREVKQATAGAVSDLSSVTARVTNAEQDISGLNSTVQGIATRVVTAEGDIDALQTSVANKADTSTVSALATQVAGKADASAVTALQSDVDDIEAVIPANASSSNKLATKADVDEKTLPDTIMHGDSVINTSFNLTDYTDMGHMFKAVYDHVKQIYEVNRVNISVILKVVIGNKIFTMYPSESNMSSQSPTFTFSGHCINLGGANPIIQGFMQMIDSDSSGYFIERFLTFANSYWGTDSSFTDGTVTGYEIKHTADETTTAPSNIIVCKMIDKAIV